MQKVFMCSLCHRGLLGGSLYLDMQNLTYKTQKLTVEKKYRNLVLPLAEIQELTWKQILLPVATFRMKSGETHQFLLFNKPRFEKWFREYAGHLYEDRL